MYVRNIACEILKWTSPIKSAVAVGLVNAGFIMNQYCNCSLLSILCHLFLLAIPVLFLVKIIKKIEVPEPEKLLVDQEKVSKIMNCMYNGINHFLHCLRNIFLFADKSKSFKVLGGLIMTYFLSRHMSDSTMVWLVIDGAFAVSFILWIRPQSREEVKEVTGKVKMLASSILSKIPHPKEKNE
jgi:hypothetical protein